MRYILSLLLVLFLCSVANANTFGARLGGPAAASSNGCPTDITYMALYNGDATAGTDYICLNSGASVLQGAIVGTLTASTDYVTVPLGDDQSLSWDLSTVFDTDPVTIYADLHVPTALTGYNTFIEVVSGTYAGDSGGGIRFRNASNGLVYVYNDGVVSSGGIVAGETETVAYSVSQTDVNGNPGHAYGHADLGETVVWTDTDEETVNTEALDDLVIGRVVNTDDADVLRVSNVIIISGWKAADPR